MNRETRNEEQETGESFRNVEGFDLLHPVRFRAALQNAHAAVPAQDGVIIAGRADFGGSAALVWQIVRITSGAVGGGGDGGRCIDAAGEWNSVVSG